ncbi:hypothetical protein VZT92_008176 [Zoarces viviparus]|uniref:Uncharacterized protein n=1 Tax=Zoarces viviparus TaxID=48416 RepID=A0AAW1FLW2_ZOAVI
MEHHKRPTRRQKQICRYVSAKTRDCCFLLKDDSYAFVLEKRADSTLVADVIRQDDTQDLFESPCKSKLFDIVYVISPIEKAKSCLLQRKDLHRKAVCLPYAEGFAVFPLLHDME